MLREMSAMQKYKRLYEMISHFESKGPYIMRAIEEDGIKTSIKTLLER
jgi:hypothetical protein